MNTLSNLSWRAAITGRWVARAVGSLVALMFLVMLLAEGAPPVWRLRYWEALPFLAVLLAFGGLVAAWKWPLAGALATLAGTITFSAMTQRSPGILWIPGGIGLLHLLCWLRLRFDAPVAGEWSMPRGVLLWGGVLVGILTLLVLNEMVINPPLMTPSGPLPAAMQGSWAGRDFGMTIRPNGEVTGGIAGQTLLGARVIRNRSWFGTLLHWRSEYLLRSPLITTPLSVKGLELSGRFGAVRFHLQKQPER